ncbi:tannase/feruloyl esterase family alpha/beta hydrolase [Novosphingobium sp. B-7]|uniref:tannase/feruloyl esterase family alpha/beta hydrolase n=1 Tax=Novosphingobium sp. B-7 TaxID=1298855 RepID=UPI0009E2C0F8|nr:tannase/feruloyl esterase family alpha/beta hydrolase [Novosphingobium sp. B-7]
MLLASGAGHTFFAHGGKLMVPHGVSDPVFSVMDTLAWRDRVVQRYGARTDDGLRVFPVAGMAHCMGGPATSHYDALGALVAWVEQHKAPDSLLATADAHTPWPGRTRPVCAWPRIARYRGGDPERADSFACE